MFEHLLWHSPSRIPMAIGASMLIVALVFWIYWTQVRGMRVPWRWLMPSLRGVALVVLVTSLIQPVIVRPRTSAERGAIVLLMDSSASMSVVDANRTPSQLVALADGLKALPPGVRPRDAAKLNQAPDTLKAITDQLFLTRGQLDYARIAEQDTTAATVKMEQLSQQASTFADVLANYPHAARLAQELAVLAGQTDLPSDQWTRQLSSLTATLTTAIAQAQTSADNDLYRANDAVRSACDDIGGLSRSKLIDRTLTSPQTRILARLLSQAPVYGFSFSSSLVAIPLQRQDGSPVSSIPLRADGDQSDIAAALSAVRGKMQGKPVQAVVLFSDGRQVGSDADLSPILSTASSPIFTVNCAGPVHKDLAMVRMTLPSNLYSNEPGVVHLELSSIGYHNAPVDVAMEVDGKRQTQRITVDDAAVTPVEFPLQLSVPGIHTVIASIPPQLGEATSLNNQLRGSVKIFGNQINVLAISSWPGWDFQYLRQALATAPYVKLQAFIAPGEGAALPLSPQLILQSDVTILSDVRADALSAEQWQAVHDLVTRQGGSVLIVPGDPKNLLELSQQAHLADLLPMQNPGDAVWRVWPGELPHFHLIVPPEQIATTPLRLMDDVTGSAQLWPQLPGMFRFMPVAAPKAHARSMLIESDSTLPVLTEMPTGAGRAFFFGARETWRWRDAIGGRYQDRFWLQLLRDMAPTAYTAQDTDIAFDADPIDATPGQVIHVRAKVIGDNIAPTVFILRQGHVVSHMSMQPSPNHAPGEFDSSLRDLSAGDYEINVSTAKIPGHARLAIQIAEPLAAELANITGDEARLRRIAAGTGGETIALEDITDLPRKIAEAGQKQPGYFEYPLWDSPYLFWFIVGCLGAEWAMRKQFGLA